MTQRDTEEKLSEKESEEAIEHMGLKLLACAVIRWAVCDLESKSKDKRMIRHKASAKKFLRGSDLNLYCGLIGVSPNNLRRKVKLMQKTQKGELQ